MVVEERILQLAKDKKKFRTSDIVIGLKDKYSRQYVSSILSKLVEEGKLMRHGSGPLVFYALPSRAKYLGDRLKKRLKNENLEEHEVLQEIKDAAVFFSRISENVESIFDYAFTEMLNNAIEHSKSGWIEAEIWLFEKKLAFTVHDYGVGVFYNVMKKRKLNSELEAIQDLLKGKVTTQPRAHSGEGIFFTSKVADVFNLESFSYRLRVDNLLKDVFIEDIPSLKGTRVQFSIATDSKRHLNDVFKQYQTDPSTYAFDKTEIKVKLYQLGTIYISRSQARRVLTGLEKFKKVILDFDQVPTIGQAFADEVFRVYANSHPEIEIVQVNMSDAVRFMVERAKQTKR